MNATQFPKWKMLVFVLLSTSDFMLTYLLLEKRGGSVYESNPVAEQTLQGGGWSGLALFKAMIVVSVLGIALYLFKRRPKIAHEVLAVGCGAVMVAVLSGLAIAVTPRGESESERSAVLFNGECPESSLESSADVAISHYEMLSEEMVSKLGANRCTLSEAVESMQSTERANDPEWRKALQRAYPTVEERALLAADLMQQAISNYKRNYKVIEIAHRLETEFRAMYGTLPVLPYQQLIHLVSVPNASAISDAQPIIAFPKIQ